MKKKISITLATILSLSCLPLNMSANAVNKTHVYQDWCSGFDFENHKANFVITGVYYSGDSTNPCDYAITYLTNRSVDENGEQLGWCDPDGVLGVGQISPYLENAESLKVGDLLYITDEALFIDEVIPACFHIEKNLYAGTDEPVNVEVNYIGNGIELWGDEFMKAVRNHVFPWMAEEYENYAKNWMTDGRYETLEVVKGDATEDEAVDILDVITVNKTVLGKETMQGYAKYVSDVNMNGEVDANDSLEIMKYVVGLTDTLDAE